MDEHQADFWARIDGGIVQEVVSTNPDGRFHPSLFFMPCHADVRSGWRYDETTGNFSEQ